TGRVGKHGDEERARVYRRWRRCVVRLRATGMELWHHGSKRTYPDTRASSVSPTTRMRRRSWRVRGKRPACGSSTSAIRLAPSRLSMTNRRVDARGPPRITFIDSFLWCRPDRGLGDSSLPFDRERNEIWFMSQDN